MTVARRWLGFTLLAIIVVAAAPFAMAFGSGLLATALGCDLNEGSIHPCPVLGLDLGYPLYAVFVGSLVALIGLPIAAVALLIWLVAAGIVWMRQRAAKNRACTNS